MLCGAEGDGGASEQEGVGEGGQGWQGQGSESEGSYAGGVEQGDCQEKDGESMRELTLEKFEDEIAKGCSYQVNGGRGVSECGSKFCDTRGFEKCRSVHRVREWMKTPGVAGVVLFKNLDMWSLNCGQSSCVVVGEDKTYKTVEECEGKWLNDLSSRRQYAECFVRAGGVL